MMKSTTGRYALGCGLLVAFVLSFGCSRKEVEEPTTQAITSERETLAEASSATERPTQKASPSVDKTVRRITSARRETYQNLYSRGEDGRPVQAQQFPELQAALEGEDGVSFDLRLASIHQLGDNLHPGQIMLLADFVKSNSLPEGMTLPQMRAFKNDILNVLGKQQGYAVELAELLRQINLDKDQDPGMRDYALQHLAIMGRDVDDGRLHWANVEGEDPALAATAMLHLLSRHRSDGLSAEDADRLGALALALAANTDAPDTSRLTALQICGQLAIPEARTIALETIHSNRTSFPFRIAAVATLGDLGAGDAEVIALLGQLQHGREVRLREPARAALARLNRNE